MDGAFIEYWLAQSLTTIPENSGELNGVLKCVQVIKAPAAIAVEGIRVGNIASCKHIIPDIATTSKTENGWNE